MGRRRPVNQFESSAFLNTMAYNIWYMRLKELAINRFKWINIPGTIDERFLENTLYEKGFALWFQDDINGMYLALTTMISGEWNVYNIPKERRAYASNDYQAYRTMRDSVIIFNNYMHTSDVAITQYYAHKISSIERVIDVNVNAQKTPLFISTTESLRLTMNNLYMQYDGNQPVIIADKRLNPDDIQVMNTHAPFVGDQLMGLKHQYLSEYLTYLGVENNNQTKKERLTTNELSGDYGPIEMYRNIGLNARKQAVDQINAMFGLSIDVEFNSNVSTLVNAAFKGSTEIIDAQTMDTRQPVVEENG